MRGEGEKLTSTVLTSSESFFSVNVILFIWPYIVDCSEREVDAAWERV
jgi:hypothetical protein